MASSRQLKTKIRKTKKLLVIEKLLGVDRGGVEPQERGDNPVPGTGRTRPSNPQIQYIKYFYKNQKLPLREILGSAGTESGTGLSPYVQYTRPNSLVNSRIK